MRTRALLLIFVALACGMAASIGVSQLVSQQRPTTTRTTTKQKIYVALQEIEAGNALSEDNVGLAAWYVDNIPDGAIERLEDLVGKFAQQRFFAGEPIIRAKLSDTAGTTTVKIPEGFRAVPVKVSVDSGGLGIIAPGDHVDVLVCVRRSAEVPSPLVRTILRDVRVFSVGDVTERYQDRDGKMMQAQTVALLLKPRQDETILLAGEVGRLQLILRRPNDPSGPTSPEDDLASFEQLLRTARESTLGQSDDRIPVSTSVRDARHYGDDATNAATTAPNAGAATDTAAESGEGWVMTVYTPEGVKILRWRNPGESPIEETAGEARPAPIAPPRAGTSPQVRATPGTRGPIGAPNGAETLRHASDPRRSTER